MTFTEAWLGGALPMNEDILPESTEKWTNFRGRSSSLSSLTHEEPVGPHDVPKSKSDKENSSSLPCKFYLMGHCEAGRQCRFSHIKPHEAPKLVCSYYLKGSCKFGNRCLLSHDLTSPNGSSSSCPSKNVDVSSSLSVKPSSASPALASCVDKRENARQESSVKGDAAATSVSFTNDRLDASDAYDKSLFGDEDDGDDILNMIGEELKNHCNVVSKLPILRAPPPPIFELEEDESLFGGSGFEGHRHPSLGHSDLENHCIDYMQVTPSSMGLPSTTDYSRLARMYASSPNLSLQQSRSVITDDVQYDTLCSFAKNGMCRYHETCRFLHGDCCPYCNLFVLHPYRQDLRQAHLMVCGDLGELEGCLPENEVIIGLECGICYEKIFSKTDSRIGLLNCDHSFCLECIRAWRQSQLMDTTVIRSCPICRVETHFITPSNMWPTSADQKQFIIDEYKNKLKTIPCKYIKNGISACPFGSSCFYAHLDEKGNPIEPSKLRVYRNEQEVRVLTSVKLSDFICTSGIK